MLNRQWFRLLLLLILSIGGMISSVAGVGSNELREMRMPAFEVEKDPQASLTDGFPASAYPLHPVDQLVTKGDRHGLVTTTTGSLVFRMWDLKLPGRFPIELGRVYDSSISDSLPPPPPNSPYEPRWHHDLGKNWILGPSTYLVTWTSGYIMATQEGDVIKWVEQPDGSFVKEQDVPSKHWKLERISPTKLVETMMDGTRWTFEYGVTIGANYGLTKVEDRSGNHLELTYTNYYLSKLENSDGAWIELLRPMYDPQYPPVSFPSTRVVQLTDSTGRQMSFDYDSSGLLTTVTDVLGNDWTFGYNTDTNEKLISATDPLGNTYLTASYNSSNQVDTFEADQGSWDITYASGLAIFADALGNEWRYDHHPNTGITTKVVEPTGGEHERFIDSANNVTSYNGPEGLSASWTYDTAHRILTHTPPGAGTDSIVYTYDTVEGWVNSVTNLDGGTTTFTRDIYGRVEEELDPAGGKWTAAYGPNGDRLTFRKPKGNVTNPDGDYEWTFTYDSYGNVIEAEDPEGKIYEMVYTAHGDLRKMRRPDHWDDTTQEVAYSEWVYERDLYGKLLSKADPLGNSWTMDYDLSGRLIRTTTPTGRVVEYDYDDHYRLGTVTIVNDGINDRITVYGYDTAGRITSKTLPNSASWIYGYDGSSRLTSVQDPLGRTWSFQRNSHGLIVNETYPGGRQVTIERDTAGRVQGRDYPGTRQEEFIYDSSGRMMSAKADEDDWFGYLERTYDNAGRITTVKTTWGMPGASLYSRELSFVYDVNGNRTETWQDNVPSQAVLLYNYDVLDRLVTVDAVDTNTDWMVTYDEYSGNRVRIDGGILSQGIISSPTQYEAWTFDIAGRVIGHLYDWPGLLEGDLQGDHVYTLDAEGEAVLEHDYGSGRTRSRTIDHFGQIVTYGEDTSVSSTTTTFQYDSVGNLSTSTTTIDQEEPIETTYDWDLAGRLVFAQKGVMTRRYTWTDSPQDDLSSAIKITRSPNDRSEMTADIFIDYANRLKSVYGNHVDLEERKLLQKQHWAASSLNLLMKNSELREDDTYSEITESIFDIGGLYRQVKDATLATDSHVYLIEQSTKAHSPTLIDSSQQMNAEYLMRTINGNYNNYTNRYSSGVETSMSRSMRLLQAIERYSTIAPISIGDGGTRVSRGLPGYVDDWLGGWLLSPETELAFAYAELNKPILENGRNVPLSAQYSSLCSMWFCAEEGSTQSALYDTCQGQTFEFNVGEAPCGQVLLDCNALPNLCSKGHDPCAWSKRYYGRHDELRNSETSDYGVDWLTGEYIYTSTDIQVFDAVGPIAFTRTYRSDHRTNDSMVGHNWRHNYSEYLEIRGGDDECEAKRVYYNGPQGQEMIFQREAEYLDYHGEADSYAQLKEENGEYKVRFINGDVHVFDNSGKIIRIEEKARTLEFEYSAVSGLLETISSNGILKLEFTYDTVYGKDLLVGVTGAGNTVILSYNSCHELEAVEKPSVKLGYDKYGHPITNSYAPRSTYTYYNPEEADCTESLPNGHKLERVGRRSYNPLTDMLIEDSPVIVNYYHHDDDMTLDWEYMKVVGQCLFKDLVNCPQSSPEIEYRYERGIETGERIKGYNKSTTYIDHRLGAGNEYEELRRYRHPGTLEQVVQDSIQGGIQRTTEFNITSDGLLRDVTYPDGTCKEYSYTSVAGINVIDEEIFKTKDSCDGGASGQIDLVTKYTYDELSGKVRTITNEGAFPEGTVPSEFDPNISPYNIYTIFYDYDYHQTEPGSDYPQGLQDMIEEWGLQPPQKLGDVHGDLDDNDSDDSEFYGNLVRIRQWDPSHPSQDLKVLKRSQPSGRLKWSVAKSGVKSEFFYYTSAEPGADSANWDWRKGGIYSLDGYGPKAGERLVPLEGNILTSYRAMASTGEEIAWEYPTGVRIENSKVSGRGKVLETITCKPGPGVQECQVGNELHKILNIARSTYDLQGRSVRTEYLDPNLNSITVSWTTYDVHDQVVSHTADPDPNGTPGQHFVSQEHLHLLSKNYYDARQRAYKLVSPEGRVRCIEYDALNRPVVSIKHIRLDTGGASCPLSDPEDVRIEKSYDVQGRVFSVSDGKGIHIFSWYDEYGRKKYLSDGRPTAAIDQVLVGNPPYPQAASWYKSISYNILGQPLREQYYGTNGKGSSGYLQVGWFEYDDIGRLTDKYVAIADTFVPSSEANMQSAPADDPNGLRIAKETYGYDVKGNLWFTVDAVGRRSETSYDPFGRRKRTYLQEKSPGGPQDYVERFYDEYGRDYSVIQVNHDPNGQAHHRSVEIKYDDWDRKIMTIGDPGGNSLVQTYTYDAVGRLKQSVKRWQDLAEYSTINDKDRVTEYDYDGVGRMTSMRLRESTSPTTWATSSYSYTDDGLLYQLIDANGSITNWDYGDSQTGGLGRVLKMLYPMANSERQVVEVTEYDKNGNPIELYYRQNESPGSPKLVLTAQYDDYNRTTGIQVSYQDVPIDIEYYGSTEQYFTYDDLGRLVQAVDRSNEQDHYGAEDIVTEFKYDTVGRLLEEDQRLPLNGNLNSHLVTHKYSLDGFNTHLYYPESYTDDGQLLERYYLTYGQDWLGRLSDISGPTDPSEPLFGQLRNHQTLVKYDYLGGDIWSRWHANHTELRYFETAQGTDESLRDALGRPTAVRTVAVNLNSDETSTITDFRYGYDRVGNLTYEQRIHEPYDSSVGIYQTRNYTVDLMDRLVRWTEGGLSVAPVPMDHIDPAGMIQNPTDSESWLLDLMGNWVQKREGSTEDVVGDYQSNSLNQYYEVAIPGENPRAIEYDWLGQMTRDETKDVPINYVYDGFGRLTQLKNDQNTVLAEYRYDALDRKVEKIVDSSRIAQDRTTRFIYDGWNSIEERAIIYGGAAGIPDKEKVRARYGYGIGLDEVVWMDRDVARNGSDPDPVTGSPDGIIEARYYLHADMLGSITAASEDRASEQDPLIVAERYTYTAYGEVHSWDQQWSESVDGYLGTSLGYSRIGLPYLYTGHRLDPESGLLYQKYRHYDPDLGRFISRDPIGLSGGMNLYAYAGAMPQQAIDPMGLLWLYEPTNEYKAANPWWYVNANHGLIEKPKRKNKDSDSDSIFDCENGEVTDLCDGGMNFDVSPRCSDLLNQDGSVSRSPRYRDCKNYSQQLYCNDEYGELELRVLENCHDPTIATLYGNEEVEPAQSYSTGGFWSGGAINSGFDIDTKRWRDRFDTGLNIIHGVCDYAGVVPGIGAVADVVNASLYLLEGDWSNALWAGVGIIPFFGDAVQTTRLAVKTTKYVNAIVDLKTASNLGEATATTTKAAESTADGLRKRGRAGKQARLRELAEDPKVSSADRGWINQEINQIERGKRNSIRNPPGKQMAHPRGREAAKGFTHTEAPSNIQDTDLHRLQHKYDNYGRKNPRKE